MKGGDVRYVAREHRGLVQDLFLPIRCFFCYDRLNAVADVAFGDPWGLGLRGSRARVTAFLARTDRGRRWLEEARAHSHVRLRLVSADAILAGQGADTILSRVADHGAAAKRSHASVPPHTPSAGFLRDSAPGGSARATLGVDWHVLASWACRHRIWQRFPPIARETVRRLLNGVRALLRPLWPAE